MAQPDTPWLRTVHRSALGISAQIRQENGRYVISKGVDVLKDQSYVLWGISQESLARTLLPLGGMTKQEIREEAKEEACLNEARKKIVACIQHYRGEQAIEAGDGRARNRKRLRPHDRQQRRPRCDAENVRVFPESVCKSRVSPTGVQFACNAFKYSSTFV